jgi:hypothetical protein
MQFFRIEFFADMINKSIINKNGGWGTTRNFMGKLNLIALAKAINNAFEVRWTSAGLFFYLRKSLIWSRFHWDSLSLRHKPRTATTLTFKSGSSIFSRTIFLSSSA